MALDRIRSIASRVAKEIRDGTFDLNTARQVFTAVPPSADAKAIAALKQNVDILTGATGSVLDKAVTLRDLVDEGVLTVQSGAFKAGSGTPGTLIPSAGSGTGGGDTVIITDPSLPTLTVAPTPTELRAWGMVRAVFLEWKLPLYANHGGTEVWRHTADNLGSATKIAEVDSTVFTDTTAVYGVTYFYWVRAFLSNGERGAYNAVAGVSTTTTRVGNTDLGPLIVESANLATGAVTLGKIASGAVTTAAFASSIEPVTLVTGASLPTTKSTNTVYWNGKLYRWNGTAYTAAVPTTDLTGQVTATQITDGAITTPKLAAGAVTADQLAANAVVAGKIAAGAVTADQIAANAVTAGKLAANSIAVGTAAIQNGAIVNAMIADAAINNAKIANLSADKITSGFIDAARIEVGSLDARIASLDAAVISTGFINIARIADASITAAKIQDASITNAKIGAVIQSSTYTAGVTGWQLDKSGSVKAYHSSGANQFDLTATGTTPVLKIGSALSILGNGTASYAGALSAASGTFAGALTAATGTFSGSLTADAVNAVSTINLADNAVTVPAAKENTWALGAWVINTVPTPILAETDSTNYQGGRVLVAVDVYASVIPPFSGPSNYRTYLEITRDGSVIRTIDLGENLGDIRHSARVVDTPAAGGRKYGVRVSYNASCSTLPTRALVTADGYKK